jgi:hypothetical protein
LLETTAAYDSCGSSARDSEKHDNKEDLEPLLLNRQTLTDMSMSSEFSNRHLTKED